MPCKDKEKRKKIGDEIKCMENRAKAIKMFMSIKGYVWVRISGISMHPVLQDGVKVKIVPSSQYEVGDILVYGYKSEGYLVHRLLKIEKNRYFCKGDNSFRIEIVTMQQIIGKVMIMEDANNDAAFADFSLKIGLLFIRNRYNAEVTKLNQEYIV